MGLFGSCSYYCRPCWLGKRWYKTRPDATDRFAKLGLRDCGFSPGLAGFQQKIDGAVDSADTAGVGHSAHSVAVHAWMEFAYVGLATHQTTAKRSVACPTDLAAEAALGPSGQCLHMLLDLWADWAAGWKAV